MLFVLCRNSASESEITDYMVGIIKKSNTCWLCRWFTSHSGSHSNCINFESGLQMVCYARTYICVGGSNLSTIRLRDCYACEGALGAPSLHSGRYYVTACKRLLVFFPKYRLG